MKFNNHSPLIILLLILTSCAFANKKIATSPMPGFYTLEIKEARQLFAQLSTVDKFKLYIWDLENWHPHNMYLGDELAKSGHKAIPYIETELLGITQNSPDSFKVWRLLTVLNAIHEIDPISCGSRIRVTVKDAITKLRKNHYEDAIFTSAQNLSRECE
ncbi:MAG TPA: hypothetical protein ENK04_05140 [Gammaproteobacteria bacterium]|nr:hypothetical protein [Gammaproteobacteria bacterium]